MNREWFSIFITHIICILCFILFLSLSEDENEDSKKKQLRSQISYKKMSGKQRKLFSSYRNIKLMSVFKQSITQRLSNEK